MAGQSVGMVTAEQPVAEIIEELVVQAVAALALRAFPLRRGVLSVTGTRRLLTRLREMMATGAAPLPDVVRLVGAEMVAEVCSIYALRPGDQLELIATHGLRPDAVGRTRLRVGEGIVGLCAATGQVMNLPDAQNHPAFAYRPETGEEPFASLLAVPVRRGGHTMGVLAVQNRSPRRYGADEVDVVETVAMLLAEALAAAGARMCRRMRWAPPCRASSRRRARARHGDRPGRAPAAPAPPRAASWPRTRRPSWRRLDRAMITMRRDLDSLIEAGLPDGRGAARGAGSHAPGRGRCGWLKRVAEAIGSGLTAEAAVVRVAASCATGCAASWILICASGWPTSRIWPRACCRRWRVAEARPRCRPGRSCWRGGWGRRSCSPGTPGASRAW